MTELLLPDRNNPEECLVWALRTLDALSRKENRGMLGAHQVRSVARRLLDEVLSQNPHLHSHPMLRKHGQLYQNRRSGEKRHLEKLLANLPRPPLPNPG